VREHCLGVTGETLCLGGYGRGLGPRAQPAAVGAVELSCSRDSDTPRARARTPPCISHPLARTRDGPSLDGRGTTGRTEDLLETKRGISKATRNYRYKKKESLAFAASRLMSSRSSRESAQSLKAAFEPLRLLTLW
jgi:hypothetical protein